MEYIATFHTHYGAIKFHSKLNTIGVASSMMPIPRVLSSSCGTCVRFTITSQDQAMEQTNEDMECLYGIEGEQYQLLYDNR